MRASLHTHQGSLALDARRVRRSEPRVLLQAPPPAERPGKPVPDLSQASKHPSLLGALAGRAKQMIGVAALAVALGGCAGLPNVARGPDFVDISAPVVRSMDSFATQSVGPIHTVDQKQPTLAETFHNLKSIGGGPAEAQLLADNLDSWNARWQMLEGATESIDSVYFILEKDPFGYSYLGHLLKKQRDGVSVRLMIDAMADTFGIHGFKMPLLGKDYLQELVGEGGQVDIYHPIWQRPFEPFSGYSFMASNHDKIISVDGRCSMTGGRNIGIEYFASPIDMPSAWRDTDIMLTGEGTAAAMSKAMDLELDDPKIISHVHADLFGNFHKRDIELIGAYLMMDNWLKAPAFSEAEKAQLRVSSDARKAVAATMVEGAVARLPEENITRTPSDGEIAFLTEQAETLVTQLESRGSRARYDARAKSFSTEAKILDQTSVASTRFNDFDVGLIQLAKAAQKRIIIENPYVVLTETMIQALEEASARGVEIIIGTNSPLSTDSAVTQAFFLEDWDYILARVPNARILVASGERKLHAKVATIDDEISIVSTYNLDLLSGYVNSEIGAVLLSKPLVNEMLKVFIDDLEDPKNGVLEYKILKDSKGRAVLRDGKPVPVFGPEDHLPEDVIKDYASRRKNWKLMRDTLPYFKPLRHPPLSYGAPQS